MFIGMLANVSRYLATNFQNLVVATQVKLWVNKCLPRDVVALVPLSDVM